MNIDIDQVSNIIKDVAAQKIAPRFQNLQNHEIRSKKSPNDLATIADDEAEEELTRILKDILPGSQVLGEEAVSRGITSRDILKENGAVWVVDPVDGTGNFAAGRPIFGSMVALIINGERIAGWIYQILLQKMTACEKGSGITIGGKAVTVEKAPDDASFQDMRAFLAKRFMPTSIKGSVEKASTGLNMESYNCCAWEYVELMQGKAAFSLYKRIEPWDHMAGVTILEEAGFYIRKWDGSGYGTSDIEGGLICAPSEIFWRRVYDTFLKEAVSLS
jgi:fructose-1,6-bisphosphatase/inositol monophosphatase family enzyme